VLNWSKEYWKGSTKDQAMFLAYDIEDKCAYHSIVGKFRYIGKDSLIISKKKGKTYHLYIAFNAHDRSNQSDSIYLGTITT